MDEFFFGFGNLIDMMYTVQPLELSTAQVDPAFCLASEAGLVFFAHSSRGRADLFDVVSSYGILGQRIFTVELLEVKFDADEVMPVFFAMSSGWIHVPHSETSVLASSRKEKNSECCLCAG